MSRNVDDSQWDGVIADFAARVEQFGPDYVFGVAIKAHERIKERTPVGDGPLAGTAKNSWQLTAEAAGVYEITTDVVYMPVLEFGEYPGVGPRTVQTPEGIFSSQAPAGMFRITAQELPAIADEAAAELARAIEG
jgi:hypothetical protein